MYIVLVGDRDHTLGVSAAMGLGLARIGQIATSGCCGGTQFWKSQKDGHSPCATLLKILNDICEIQCWPRMLQAGGVPGLAQPLAADALGAAGAPPPWLVQCDSFCRCTFVQTTRRHGQTCHSAWSTCGNACTLRPTGGTTRSSVFARQPPLMRVRKHQPCKVVEMVSRLNIIT